VTPPQDSNRQKRWNGGRAAPQSGRTLKCEWGWTRSGWSISGGKAKNTPGPGVLLPIPDATLIRGLELLEFAGSAGMVLYWVCRATRISAAIRNCEADQRFLLCVSVIFAATGEPSGRVKSSVPSKRWSAVRTRLAL
jgi:hypothetical protein